MSNLTIGEWRVRSRSSNPTPDSSHDMAHFAFSEDYRIRQCAVPSFIVFSISRVYPRSRVLHQYTTKEGKKARKSRRGHRYCPGGDPDGFEGLLGARTFHTVTHPSDIHTAFLLSSPILIKFPP
ncbi:hypothetical protein CC2G_014392 [Coprinopsis cinerea AmutBmut pab1-1]|nr:hypothetical protein CC2G_014392 [Coprinopsis cinerea AmutBmut pab1-1]